MSVKTFMSVKAVIILTAHISLLFPIHSLTSWKKKKNPVSKSRHISTHLTKEYCEEERFQGTDQLTKEFKLDL